MRRSSKIFFDSLQQRILNPFHQLHNVPRLEVPLRKDRLAQDKDHAPYLYRKHAVFT
jgi:hypothetical protein